MKNTFLLELLLLFLALPLRSQVSDDFEGDRLIPGWSWLREETSRWRLMQGSLIIYTQPGALNGVLFNNVRNLLVQPYSPGREISIETRLIFDPLYEYRNAGLLYYINDDNYIRLSRGIFDGHDDVWMEWEVAGVTQFVYAGAMRPLSCYLRLDIMSGGRFRARWSLDSIIWKDIADRTIAFPAQPVFVGLQAANGDGMAAPRDPISAIFDYFLVIDGVSVDPLAGPVRFTLGNARPSPARAGEMVTVSFSTDRAARLSWRLTDLLGREILPTRDLGMLSSGKHDLHLPLYISTPGVYLLHLQGGEYRATQRIVVSTRQ